MDLVSVTEFSEAVGITPQGVRKAIVEGRIKARKIGKFWVIKHKEILRFTYAKG